MKLIETKTLGSAAASIEFTSIPQDGTDLFAIYSLRNSVSSAGGIISFNTGGTYSRRRLQGSGSSVASDTASVDYQLNPSSFTSSTFGNGSIYVPNYTSSNAKSYSTDSISETNATEAYQAIIAGLWTGTAAITTLTFTPLSSGNFEAGSIISLYKITKGTDGIVVVS
jgi:hypothetical protein